MSTETPGFSPARLPVVVAIIAILVLAGLAARMLLDGPPSSAQASPSVNDRAALAYAERVRQAGRAYLAERPDHSFPPGNCGTGRRGTAFGTHSVPAPGDFVTECVYTENASKVQVGYVGGTRTIAEFGNDGAPSGPFDNDRAARVYAQNILRAGLAYLAEDPRNAVPEGPCGTGGADTVFGRYSAPPPGPFVVACRVGANVSRVLVVYTGGTSNIVELGR